MDWRTLYGNLTDSPRGNRTLGTCGHRPSSSYLRALVEKAAHHEPTLEKEQLISALEALPMAELREGKGVIFCDVLDAHAYLEWLADSRTGPHPWAGSFQHTRQEVLDRTLVHEGVEWVARRLDLLPLLRSA